MQGALLRTFRILLLFPCLDIGQQIDDLGGVFPTHASTITSYRERMPDNHDIVVLAVSTDPRLIMMIAPCLSVTQLIPAIGHRFRVHIKKALKPY